MNIEGINDSVQLSEQAKQARQVSEQKAKGKAPAKVATADTATAGDTLAISDEAREKATIARYIQRVKELPDIREDRVAEVKRRLEAGEYSKSDLADKIAQKMIEE